MSVELTERAPVLVVTPFEEPDPRIALAAGRSGALGVLDLGRDAGAARTAVEEMLRWAQRGSVPARLGVRAPVGCPLAVGELPVGVFGTVLLPQGSPWGVAEVRATGRRVLAEVVSVDEARAAAEQGADGLVARGSEGGGRVGRLSSLMLLQSLLADPVLGRHGLPVWSAGGIGPHSAAAAVAGGAVGVLLDTQLALSAEARLPSQVASALSAMDGGETVVHRGHRVYARPDLPVDRLDGAEDMALRLGARDLRAQYLPVGQDAFLARQLADRYGTTGGIVRAFTEAVAGHLEAAGRMRPLAPGSAFASAHGLRYPIAQGPMTRVSDRAPFAAAVAEGGALPFLALAVLPPGEVAHLLSETAALLGDRPWGVGLLGFVAAELREAQLAAVLAARPPYALIAGGRPDQAVPLEAAGIRTYLHAPSAALLDQYLAEGARRFVFEGRECGGHVGPRSSFALWDAQVERLLAFLDTRPEAAAELQLLFAGGVHDARSAAMVAALAAPLAERGVGIGVLMGTAYLFTEEAVAVGAVGPVFQQAALDCERTVLLETAPGHATRCGDTPYVQAFRAAANGAAAEGGSRQEQWERLEQLNLGRLRIASKGLRREGAELVGVGEEEQRAEGLFMLGDVAALRDRTTTVEALHEEVVGGAVLLADRAADAARADASSERAVEPLDIAIVGMAGVFPGAPDLPAYWAQILAGRDAVTEVSADRWSAERHFGVDTPSTWGGFLPPVPFDALAYGIPPASLPGIDTTQLLALEVSARALRDAGYDPGAGGAAGTGAGPGAGRAFDRARTSVVFGAAGGSELAGAYGFRSAHPALAGELPEALDRHLPRLSDDSFPGVLGNIVAGRVANRLDLGGANFTVDAACASSLAALDAACKELRSGSSEMVLCGGADLHNGINDFTMFASVHALSPTGRCRSFAEDADGIALGEAVACVVLKRLADAERDGDRVYAVVKGVGSSSDGRSLGLTAPREDGQRSALRRAYAAAGIGPERIGLIEAHGTGTVVGDRAELAALTEVFTEAGAAPGSCALGSVKSQIGHTKCAAGLAGLVKAALALHTGVRPPTRMTRPGGYWQPQDSPFAFDTAARPWAAEPAERCAGVSAFGFGGTNFHAVIAGYGGAEEAVQGRDDWPSELFLFRGHDREQAGRELDRLAELLRVGDTAGRPWRLRDLARTVSAVPPTGGAARPVQLAVVADGWDDLAAKVARAQSCLDGRAVPGESVFLAGEGRPDADRLAFLFPGQGSQRTGMLADLFLAFPRLQHHLRDADPAWVAALHPPAAFTPEQCAAQQAALTDTRIAQPALGLAELAVHELLGALGVHPDAAAGHSYGELVALYAAGALDRRTLLALSRARGEAVAEAAREHPGGMAAVGADPASVRAVLPEGLPVVLANHHAPDQVVLSGSAEAVAQAVQLLEAAGIAARPLPVACAFHSPAVAAAADVLAARMADLPVRAPRFPVWSNVGAAVYPGSPGSVRATLAAQVAAPVEWVAQIEAMYAAGVRIFVEAGPGRVLTGLVGRILGDRPHTAVACDVPGEPGLRRLLLTLGQLAVLGVPVDAAALFSGRDAALIGEGEPPRRPGWIIEGPLIRDSSGRPLPGALQPAPAQPLVGTQPAAAAAAGEREQTAMEYLRTTRQLVAAQRDVMLAYFGAEPTLEPLPTAVPAVAVPQTAEVEASPAGPRSAAELLALVLEIVGRRTGYPLEMLDPDLDLEADLSIDSIKRTEILGEVARRIGLMDKGSGMDTGMMEELARLKSVRAVVDWIVAAADAVADVPAQRVPGADRPGRYLVLPAPAPWSEETLDAHPAGRRYLLVPDGPGGVAAALTSALEAGGAQVMTRHQEGEGLDGLIHIAALGPHHEPLAPLVYPAVRAALLDGAGSLLLVHGPDPTGAGLPGLARTIAREYPSVRVRSVTVNPEWPTQATAGIILRELADSSVEVTVTHIDGVRTAPRLVAAAIPAVAPGIQGPSLDADAVVLLTGGARGITARCARALARATGCHLELVGRAPAPGAEDPAYAGAADAAGLRAALIAGGLRNPAEIEVRLRGLLTDREIRATLGELSRSAATVRYHSADVRDPDALAAIVRQVRKRHGRIDGVVHGAGVLDDRLIRDKTPDSFHQVFSTKVDGARALVSALAEGDCSELRFLALFGSVSGVLGNRGQADYAAANDALATLAREWSGQFKGRVVSLDWGPWASADGGMVSEELAREYTRRGIALIDPDQGAACLLRELALPDAEAAAQVVYLCGDPAAYAAGAAERQGPAHVR